MDKTGAINQYQPVWEPAARWFGNGKKRSPKNLMAGAENPVVLMLHGFFGGAHNWRACADALSPRYRVLAPQLPFFGLQPHEDRLGQVTDFLGGLMAEQNAGRMVIVGNSLGGHLAVNLALRAPERVVGLVLTGSAGLYERNLVRKIQRRPGRDWVRERIMEIFFDESLVTCEMVDEVLDLLDDRQKALGILRMAKTIRFASVRELLPQVRCPVLLIWGADDKITPPGTAREFQSLLPDADLHFISRCGHAPMMERPGEFTRLVEDFLRDVPARNRCPCPVPEA